MVRARIINVSIIIAVVGVLGAAGVLFYLFNKPHRDIHHAQVDFRLTSVGLVREYLESPDKANEKYLRDDGNSRVLAVSGRVHGISRDMNDQSVILLKDEGEKAGVSCTFTSDTNHQTDNLKVGQSITVKGVIRSGAGYDEDLGLYEDVILEKCSLL